MAARCTGIYWARRRPADELSPHPEEPRSGVSKDEARASWFETREDALLTMRGTTVLGDDVENTTIGGIP
jgi:hypothetical protein